MVIREGIAELGKVDRCHVQQESEISISVKLIYNLTKHSFGLQ